MAWDDCLLGIETMDEHYGMATDDLKFCYDILSGLIGPMIVELGVCHGRSSALLAYLAKQGDGRYVGIDNWSLEGSRQEVDEALSLLGLPHELYEADSRTLVLSLRPIDVLLIDAGHDEANVSMDCAQWIPLLASGGYVIFDDWPASSENREDNPHWAVKHYGDLHTKDWIEWSTPRVMVRRKP